MPSKAIPSSVPPRYAVADSDAPRSGIRLSAPLAVPRPAARPGSAQRRDLAPREIEDTFVDFPNAPPPAVSAPTPSRPGRAAVRPRPARSPGGVVLPPALESVRSAPASVPGARAPAPAAPSSYKLRSFTATAEDWPIVDPSAEGAGLARLAPRFGLDLSNASRGSLPAFVPPASLSFPPPAALDVDAADDAAAFDLEGAARRARWTGFAILAAAIAVVVVGWLSF